MAKTNEQFIATSDGAVFVKKDLSFLHKLTEPLNTIYYVFFPKAVIELESI